MHMLRSHPHSLHRVDETNVKREESLNEKKAHLDMQNIMEQHYKAKVTLQAHLHYICTHGITTGCCMAREG